jgi:hypothetical protein
MCLSSRVSTPTMGRVHFSGSTEAVGYSRSDNECLKGTFLTDKEWHCSVTTTTMLGNAAFVPFRTRITGLSNKQRQSCVCFKIVTVLHPAPFHHSVKVKSVV